MTRSATTDALVARRERAVPRGPFNVHPLFVDRAEGWRIWDVEGREYIDFCGGIGVQNVGHNHPRVVAAVEAQAKRYLHTGWHVVMYEPYVRLAERLNELAPAPKPAKTVLFNSGAEATENAVKIARAFTGRTAAVSFERGFHGRTLLAMSLTGKVRPYTAGFGPFAPEVYHLPYEPFFGRRARTDGEVERECRAAFEHLFAYQAEPERIACLLMEPVLGEGGFLPAHPVAFRTARAVCAEHGILFVSDEVQTGFGRTGALFGCQRFGVEADMVLAAKSLAAGLPLSAVTGAAAVLDAPPVGGLGGTYGGNPLACAAANAVLDILEEERLAERALALGRRVMEVFEGLAARYEAVVDARGLGAMCGLEIADGERADAIVAEARSRGLLLMTASGTVLRTLMPLVIPDDALERALGILEESVAAVCG